MKLAAPRLLPIVIAAATALLLFKGIGIVTQGGYTLVGTTPAIAAGGGAKAPAAEEASSGESEGGGGGAEGSNMTDQSPTLEDKSVTMEFPSGEGGKAEGGKGEGGKAEGGKGEGEKAEGGAPAEGAAPEIGPSEAAAEACPPTEGAAPAEGKSAEGEGGKSEGAKSEGGAEAPAGPCLPSAGVNEYGDALPLIKDNVSGKMVPLADTLKDASSEGAINDRLSERRADLDAREKEIEMRTTLLDAAEKRIEERSAELKAMEEKINKLVDDNKTAEQQQFVALVAMYENMKPKDAATIFNQLDMPVLLGVSKAMNPRKMAPILARMDPMKAKALTDGIAASNAPAAPAADTASASPDLTNLPQIVGQ